MGGGAIRSLPCGNAVMSLHAAIATRRMNGAATVRIGSSRVMMRVQHHAPRAARQQFCARGFLALILQRGDRLENLGRSRTIHYLFVPPNHTVTEHNHAFGELCDVRLVRHHYNRKPPIVQIL